MLGATFSRLSKSFGPNRAIPTKGIMWRSFLFMASLLMSFSSASAQEAEAATNGNWLGLSVHHVTMGVANMERQRAFYRDVLGFHVGPFNKRSKYDHQQMLIPGFRIDMIEYPGSTRPGQTMGADMQGWLHVAFTVPNASVVYERLRAEGVPVAIGRQQKDHIGSIFVTDPEGNRLELAE